MADLYWMRQCTLQRELGCIILETTSWIPEEFAHIDNYVKLKDGDDWVDGWKVVLIGNRKQAVEVHERSRDYTKQRKASDI